MYLKAAKETVGVLACVLFAVAACRATTLPASSQGQAPSTYTRAMPIIDPVDWSARGTVVSSSDVTQLAVEKLPPGSSTRTMVYRSISGITGAPSEVSGALFTPPGEPPAGGWPVVGYAHGTVGITRDCGPTADPDLYGDIKAVATQLQQGYAVAFTDYAGLGDLDGGSDGAAPHAYLEPKSAAFNLIDAVRAARAIEPDLSSRWVALGASQGGAAAWATAEYFPEYGQGTDLLGSAALVPALDVSGLVQRAQDATLTLDQKYLYPYVVSGLAAVDNSIEPNDLLHGVMEDDKDILLACRPPLSQRKGELAQRLKAMDSKPTAALAAERLYERLASYALPQQPTKVPIVSIYGGADRTVLPEWTEVAMGRGCALGDTILRVRLDGQGHTLDPGTVLGTWMANRFAGVPATGNC